MRTLYSEYVFEWEQQVTSVSLRSLFGHCKTDSAVFCAFFFFSFWALIFIIKPELFEVSWTSDNKPVPGRPLTSATAPHGTPPLQQALHHSGQLGRLSGNLDSDHFANILDFFCTCQFSREAGFCLKISDLHLIISHLGWPLLQLKLLICFCTIQNTVLFKHSDQKDFFFF